MLQNDINYSAHLSTADILGMDQLYTRSGNQFAGAAIWGIETVPEPSSTLMLGLGGALALIRRRRK